MTIYYYCIVYNIIISKILLQGVEINALRHVQKINNNNNTKKKPTSVMAISSHKRVVRQTSPRAYSLHIYNNYIVYERDVGGGV